MKTDVASSPSPTLRSLITGALQGVSEFLPISSSFHLRLLPYALGWPPIGVPLSVLLHVGTLVAVVAYFWRDLSSIFAELGQVPWRETMALKLAIATLPAVMVGALLHDLVGRLANNMLLISACLVLVGLLLWCADQKHSSIQEVGGISIKQAAIVGLGQSLALVPGVSRSGITITFGRFLGLDREASARFSFLMSVPVIFGAACLESWRLIRDPSLLSVSGLDVAGGMLAAAVVGYLSIAFLLRWVAQASFFPFAIYRVVVGLGAGWLASRG